ncbi:MULTISPECIES: hypothetical protein [Novosphingobium]|jgi:hypothetical protein|uniref:hypothetical protein n=1 Tax=Novosphingobium TaxID=165696 RepID=UPI0022F29E34|nr:MULTISPECIES: hypothetical protein [Novosphingobium]GLK45896.1 hypothetical protein GCM10017612_38160 [Novosphingobium resinovorum]
MSSLAFYREQADLQTIAADAASLPQVRDRCLRAVSAWNELADRAQKTEDARKVKNSQAEVISLESSEINFQ